MWSVSPLRSKRGFGTDLYQRLLNQSPLAIRDSYRYQSNFGLTGGGAAASRRAAVRVAFRSQAVGRVGPNRLFLGRPTEWDQRQHTNFCHMISISQRGSTAARG